MTEVMRLLFFMLVSLLDVPLLLECSIRYVIHCHHCSKDYFGSVKLEL
jgi:hypothetical protein